MSGLRERKKRQTRDAIVSAAVKLFADKGFEQTSMEELASKSGVGKGTIYGYFKSKSDILLAFLEEEVEHAFAALNEKIDADAPLEEQLLALMLGQLTYVTRNSEFGRIFSRELLFPADRKSPKSRELDMRYLGKILAVLGEAQKRRELPPETDLLLMMGHLHALYLVTLSSFYQGDIETLAEGEVLLRGLIRQALGGPGSQGYNDQGEKKEWDALKQNFLKRRELEL